MNLFKKSLPKVEVKADSGELDEALKIQKELIYFYQMGYLDAWIVSHTIKTHKGRSQRKHEIAIFKRIEPRARECFDKRFLKEIAKRRKEKNG